MPDTADPITAAGRGLTDEDVAARRATAGWNELPRPERTGPITVLARQFTGLLVLILIAAALIALALGETVDAIVIALVVVLNGILGFVQEWRAERALEALHSMMTPRALVVRNGAEVVVASRDLVPGDLVIVGAGDSIPADMDLIAATELRVDESVVTGESVPVAKSPGRDGGAAGTLLTGTAVSSGRGEGIVTATGAATAFGRIAELTGAVGLKRTHLQRKLAWLAQQLGLAAVMIALVIVVLGVAVGRPLFEMFMTGLSLAVAMVPEGLPAVLTITLALGAAAMARRKALARRLQAVETLGAASVICTDKTGTLTENKMTATRVWTADARFDVTGTGHDPAGHIAQDGRRVRAEHDAVLARLLETALVCNHATLRRVGHDWSATGAPTEAALVTLAYKGWAPLPAEGARLAEVPFSSERKRMSVLARTADGCRLHTKGAPETVLDRCTTVAGTGADRPLDDGARAQIREAYRDMAAEGLRVIALAARAADPVDPADTKERGLVFLGLVGLIDPPRPEVRRAIAGAKAAGIRVIVITGDGAVTASAIAAQLGMGKPRCIEGAELDTLSDDALRVALEGDVLFARTLPEHKMRIVEALQARGHIVAMTGDGVNDAPALKRADIGIAMGIRGTDVSKDAADLVLLDDNFATIVAAISEGRRQFENVTKFVRYLLASNAGEVVAICVNLVIGGPLILLATQILWMNLVTDGVTAVALGLEKAEPGQMNQPPRRPDAPIVGVRGLALIAAFGCYTGGASLWLFYTLLPQGEDVARTAAFTGLVVFEKLSVFAFRSLREPCWRIGWLSNPFLLAALAVTLGLQALAVSWPPMQLLLSTTMLAAGHVALIAALAAPLVLVPEVLKSLVRRPISTPVPA